MTAQEAQSGLGGDPLTVREVFGAAGLVVQGPVKWREPLPERSPGVYLVALVGILRRRSGC